MGEVPKNTYLTQFAQPNSEAFAGLNLIDQKIRLEKTSWFEGVAVNQITRGHHRNFASGGLHHMDPGSAAWDQTKKIVRAAMFGITTGREGSSLVDHTYKKIVSSNLFDQEMLRLENLGDEHGETYKAAINRFSTRQQVMFGELVDKWKDFVSADPSNLSQFNAFLTKPEFEGPRSDQRSFFVLMRERIRDEQSKGRTDFVDATTTALIRNLTDRPNPEVLQMVSEGPTSNAQLREWLEMVSFPSEAIDITRIHQAIQGGHYPSQLNLAVKATLDRAIIPEATTAKASLGLYKPETDPSVHFVLIDKSKGRNRGNVGIPRTSFQSSYQTNVVNFAFEIPTDDLDTYIADLVPATKTNIDLRDDLAGVVTSLAYDPYQIGLGVIVDSELFSFNPAKLPVPRRDAQTDLYRVVLEIGNDGDPAKSRQVIIQEILKAQDFQAKYQAK